MEQSVDLLKRQIREAFRDVPPPVKPGLDAMHYGEGGAVIWDANGRSWEELLQDRYFLAYHAPSLPLLSPSEFRFFLPAYLIASLDDPELATDIEEFTLFNLTPSTSDDKDGDVWLLRRIELLDRAQREAIRAFLEHECSNPNFSKEATAALCYWRAMAQQVDDVPPTEDQ
jgi:hypothetical protein